MDQGRLTHEQKGGGDTGSGKHVVSAVQFFRRQSQEDHPHRPGHGHRERCQKSVEDQSGGNGRRAAPASPSPPQQNGHPGVNDSHVQSGNAEDVSGAVFLEFFICAVRKVFPAAEQHPRQDRGAALFPALQRSQSPIQPETEPGDRIQADAPERIPAQSSGLYRRSPAVPQQVDSLRPKVIPVIEGAGIGSAFRKTQFRPDLRQPSRQIFVCAVSFDRHQHLAVIPAVQRHPASFLPGKHRFRHPAPEQAGTCLFPNQFFRPGGSVPVRFQPQVLHRQNRQNDDHRHRHRPSSHIYSPLPKK